MVAKSNSSNRSSSRSDATATAAVDLQELQARAKRRAFLDQQLCLGLSSSKFKFKSSSSSSSSNSNSGRAECETHECVSTVAAAAQTADNHEPKQLAKKPHTSSYTSTGTNSDIQSANDKPAAEGSAVVTTTRVVESEYESSNVSKMGIADLIARFRTAAPRPPTKRKSARTINDEDIVALSAVSGIENESGEPTRPLDATTLTLFKESYKSTVPAITQAKIQEHIVKSDEREFSSAPLEHLMPGRLQTETDNSLDHSTNRRRIQVTARCAISEIQNSKSTNTVASAQQLSPSVNYTVDGVDILQKQPSQIDPCEAVEDTNDVQHTTDVPPTNDAHKSLTQPNQLPTPTLTRSASLEENTDAVDDVNEKSSSQEKEIEVGAKAEQEQLEIVKKTNTNELKMPRKNKTPYMLFCAEKRAEHKTINLSEAGAEWRSMGDEGQEKYVTLAEQDKTRYDNKMKIYNDSLVVKDVTKNNAKDTNVVCGIDGTDKMNINNKNNNNNNNSIDNNNSNNNHSNNNTIGDNNNNSNNNNNNNSNSNSTSDESNELPSVEPSAVCGVGIYDSALRSGRRERARVLALWDIENVHIPRRASSFRVVAALRARVSALLDEESKAGRLPSAWSVNAQPIDETKDFLFNFHVAFRLSAFHSPSKATLNNAVRRELTTAGVSLIDVGKDKPGQADTVMKSHMEVIASEQDPQLVVVILLTSDTDFISNVRELGEYGFRVVVVLNSNATQQPRQHVLQAAYAQVAWRTIFWGDVISYATSKSTAARNITPTPTGNSNSATMLKPSTKAGVSVNVGAYADVLVRSSMSTRANTDADVNVDDTAEGDPQHCSESNSKKPVVVSLSSSHAVDTRPSPTPGHSPGSNINTENSTKSNKINKKKSLDTVKDLSSGSRSSNSSSTPSKPSAQGNGGHANTITTTKTPSPTLSSSTSPSPPASKPSTTRKKAKHISSTTAATTTATISTPKTMPPPRTTTSATTKNAKNSSPTATATPSSEKKKQKNTNGGISSSVSCVAVQGLLKRVSAERLKEYLTLQGCEVHEVVWTVTAKRAKAWCRLGSYDDVRMALGVNGQFLDGRRCSVTKTTLADRATYEKGVRSRTILSTDNSSVGADTDDAAADDDNDHDDDNDGDDNDDDNDNDDDDEEEEDVEEVNIEDACKTDENKSCANDDDDADAASAMMFPLWTPSAKELMEDQALAFAIADLESEIGDALRKIRAQLSSSQFKSTSSHQSIGE